MTRDTFAVLSRAFTRRRKTPAPAASPRPVPDTPVPGQHAPEVRPSPPSGHAPAPALPARHGGIDYSLRVWKCGRIRMWDGNGTLQWCKECRCPSGADWHAWESELSR